MKTTPPTEELIERLAIEFATVLRAWLGLEKITEINRRNKLKKYANCCASHDFCDSNMAMEEAFMKIAGHELMMQDVNDLSLWNQAWSKAKSAGFKVN